MDALNVPEVVEINVEGAEDGYQLFAGDVVLPGDAELINDAEILVVSVALPRVEEEPVESAESEGTVASEVTAAQVGSSGAPGRDPGRGAPLLTPQGPGRRAVRGAPVLCPRSCATGQPTRNRTTGVPRRPGGDSAARSSP